VHQHAVTASDGAILSEPRAASVLLGGAIRRDVRTSGGAKITIDWLVRATRRRTDGRTDDAV